MPIMFRIAAMGAIAAAIAGGCSPKINIAELMGWSELSLLGLLLGIAFLVVESTDILKSSRPFEKRKGGAGRDLRK